MDTVNIRILVLILGMYFAAIILTMYNKWMFDPTRSLHIPYPLMVTGFHQLLLWAMSYLYLRQKGELTPHNLNQGDWKYYMRYIIPTAAATAGDIGFGNISFKYVPFTVYTIVKSSTIAFVLFFGCLFKVEIPSWRLFCIVITMFIGVVLMGLKPVSATGPKDVGELQETFGVLLVVASCALGGFRWVYVQVILNHKKNEIVLPSNDTEILDASKPVAKKNPIITLHQLAMPMTVMLFLTSLVVERPFPDVIGTQLLSWEDHSRLAAVLRGICLLVFPSVLVLMLTMCEFGILQLAPVLTLSVTGIIKELLTVFLGMLVFHERLGLYNWIGMVIVMVDVCYYNWFRYTQRKALSVEDAGPVAWDPKSSMQSSEVTTALDPEALPLQEDSKNTTTVWEMDSMGSPTDVSKST